MIRNRSVLHTEGRRSLTALAHWRDDPNVPWPQRVECAMELLRQGYGRAPQAVGDDAIAGNFALKVYITPMEQAEQPRIEAPVVEAIPVTYRQLRVAVDALGDEVHSED